jgi:hypothetical protein
MLRYIIALGVLASVTAPAVAQVDTSRDERRYAFDAGTREGWLGIGISCSRCTLAESDDGQTRQWTFSEPPLVFSVDRNGPADRAALRTGDTLVAIDGAPFTSAQGGTAFANIRPGQSLRLTYRRDGTERTVRLIAMKHPADSRNMALAARAMRRAQAAQERQFELSRGELERSRVQLERVRSQMEQMAREQDSSGLDSARLELMARELQAQASVLDRLLAERRSLEDETPEPAMPAMPPTAAMPAQPAMPAMPAMPAQPAMPAMPAMPRPLPTGPLMPWDWRRLMGPLRFAGRIGDVLVEVRGPGEVTTSNVTDSVTTITSGDMSVLLELRPRATPKPAAQPPRPPRD